MGVFEQFEETPFPVTFEVKDISGSIIEESHQSRVNEIIQRDINNAQDLPVCSYFVDSDL